jgi:hypothetical protein
MSISGKERKKRRNKRVNSIGKSLDLLSPAVIGHVTLGAVRSQTFVATLGRSLL